ncbi:hypothetical protein GCM10010327_29030 [Streptomyces nitrosporeus]|nr:hypothetical protein GCM10010327_29030 [Streptomyces nitrosporeus]
MRVRTGDAVVVGGTVAAEPHQDRVEAPVGRVRETGDPTAVRLLYLAVSWLIVEQLTLPDVFTEAERVELVTAAVARIVPAGTPA